MSDPHADRSPVSDSARRLARIRAIEAQLATLHPDGPALVDELKGLHLEELTAVGDEADRELTRLWAHVPHSRRVH
jgi:hypothetical protein